MWKWESRCGLSAADDIAAERIQLSTERDPSLKQHLGLGGVFSVAAGAMISSGLFVLPAVAFARVGPAMILAYLLGGVLNLPAMFAQAELSTAMPKSGGSYFTIERSLGAYAGTLAGFISWLCISLKAAFACVGIGTLAILLFPEWGEWGMKAAAAAACLLFALLNVLSVKETGRLQNILVAMLLGVLVAFVLGTLSKVDAARYSPFWLSDWRTFLAVTGMVFISYGGLTKVVDIAEEVKNPQRNLVIGMFLAFGVVNLIYVAAVFVTVGLLDAEVLSGTFAPLALAAESGMGAVGSVAVGFAAFLAYATTGNAGILAASRSPLAMSRDGLLPARLSCTGQRFGTPHSAIMLTTAFMLIVILFLTVEEMAKTASTMFLISFALLNASVIVMRKAGLQGYRPSFKVPLCPWFPAAGVVIYSLLIIDMGRIPLLVTGLFLLSATMWYIVYVQRRINRESAVVYMVRGLLSGEIRRTALEDELVRISLEREGIVPDRFDELVRGAPVLDLAGSMDARDMFRRIAEAMSPQLNLTSDDLYERFVAREKESSTVIRPGVAVPHVVVPGEDVFALALVRLREGAVFSELHPPVRAAFVFAASRDQRNFHLRALVAAAHIINEPDFDERWTAAANEEQLRDLVLLSSRSRDG